MVVHEWKDYEDNLMKGTEAKIPLPTPKPQP